MARFSSRTPLALALALGVGTLAGCSDPTPAPTTPPPEPQAPADPADLDGPVVPASAQAAPAPTPSPLADVDPQVDPLEASHAPHPPGNVAREITLYSGGFAAVARGHTQAGWAWAKEEWAPDLTQPILVRQGLPLTTDPTTVVLEPAAGAQVQGQRMVGGHDPQTLREQAVGKQVQVWAPGLDQPLSGTLINATGPSWILADGDQVISVEQAVAWRGEAQTGGESRWEWDVVGAGQEGLWSLSYGFSGMAWQADTVLTLTADAGQCQVAWQTDALIANYSGKDLQATSVSLVAGDPRHDRDQFQAAYPMRSVGSERMDMAAAAPPAPAPTPMASGEQYRYVLEGMATLPQGAIARTPLVRPSQAVACERQYVVGNPRGPGVPSRPWVGGTGGAGEQDLPVQWQLALANTSESGLGMPLPAGRVRVMEDGSWAGDARLEHTAVGEEMELVMGQPFDLTATRTVVDFSLDADRLGASETVRIALRNAKDENVTIQVHESFPRWRNWELREATVQPSQTHAQGARFDVVAPADSVAVLEYTVHYRWPDMGPQ